MAAQGFLGRDALRTMTDETIEMARNVADTPALISGLSARMWIAQYQGDVDAAIKAEEEVQSLDLTDLDARTRISLIEMRTLAAGAKHGLESDEYVEQLRAQRAEAAEAGWEGEQAIAAGNLAQILSVRGEHAEAAAMNGESARLFRALERPADLGWALSYQAAALAEIGRTSEAVEAAIEAAVIADAVRLPMTMADSLRTSMPVAISAGMPLLAAHLWGAVHAMNDRGFYVLPPVELEIGEEWLTRATALASAEEIDDAIRAGAAEDPLDLVRALPELLRGGPG